MTITSCELGGKSKIHDCPKKCGKFPFVFLYNNDFIPTRPPMFRDFPQNPWLFKIMKCALGTTPLGLHTLPLHERDRTSAPLFSGKVCLIITSFLFLNGAGFVFLFFLILQNKPCLPCSNQIRVSVSTKITANSIKLCISYFLRHESLYQTLVLLVSMKRIYLRRLLETRICWKWENGEPRKMIESCRLGDSTMIGFYFSVLARSIRKVHVCDRENGGGNIGEIRKQIKHVSLLPEKT